MEINDLCQKTTNPAMLNALHACRDGHPLNHTKAWRNAFCLASQASCSTFDSLDLDWLQKRALDEASHDPSFLKESEMDAAVELLREVRPIVERSATEEARANRAPTGLPKRTKMRDLLERIDNELKQHP